MSYKRKSNNNRILHTKERHYYRNILPKSRLGIRHTVIILPNATSQKPDMSFYLLVSTVLIQDEETLYVATDRGDVSAVTLLIGRHINLNSKSHPVIRK